jgi:hypothetical protein
MVFALTPFLRDGTIDRSLWMKTWIKQGLGLLAGLAFSAVAAAASEPIKDRDAFEKKYIECITSGLKNKCLSALLTGHFIPDAEGHSPFIHQTVAQLQKIEELADQFGNVYQVRPLDKIIRADTWDSRTYLTEHSNGRFSGAYLCFTRVKGEWYVSSFRINTKKEFLREILKLQVNLPLQ